MNMGCSVQTNGGVSGYSSLEPYLKLTLTTSLSLQSHACVEVTEAHSFYAMLFTHSLPNIILIYYPIIRIFMTYHTIQTPANL